MRSGRLRVAVVAACLLLAPAAALAQSSISGSVTDNTGGVLPGVTIEAASDALIEGSRVVFTDGTGQYTLIDLRPGTYTVTFTLPGFGTVIRDQIALLGDVTLNLDATLSVGSLEETVTVSGATPVVDVQQVQRIEVMTRETQEAIPSGRSTWSYALLIPGVKVHKPDVGGTAGAQQSEMMGRGLDAAHTTVEIDGMMINTMISDGRYQAYINPMLAAETSYTTSGVTAETQNGGLRINMIPNEGGNSFSGNVFAGGTPSQFQADNWSQRLGDLGVTEVPKVDLIYDINGYLGGPIVRDRLWFFSTQRRNVIDAGVLNSTNRDGTPALDRNSITSANVRLTWQMNSQNKISAMFDKVRKRRFSQHSPGTDLETAAASWHSPHYDTGTAKWTSTISSRMLAEFGFSLAYEDWDPGYYTYGDIPIRQDRPSDGALATCFETPCYPEVGSARHMAQLSPAMGGDPWYSVVSRRDNYMGLLHTAKDDGEVNNYTHRWAYQGALSYVTGSHNFKFGANFTNGHNRFTRSSNGNLRQTYDSAPDPGGRVLDWVGCDHFAATVNLAADRPCGLTGVPDQVRIFAHPIYTGLKLNYNGGFYAQDSWTIDRLTINYGARIDISAVSVPETPKGLGRFTEGYLLTGRPSSELPRFGPDLAPRLSVAYDLFGDARTALKFGWNKYVRDVGGNLPGRYSYGAAINDDRDWYDCHLDPVAAATGSAACSGLNPYGSNFDDIAQNWEIGQRASSTFGSPSDPTRSPDLDNYAREYNSIWTAGLQQEITTGLSISAEYRQRTYHNTWSENNRDRTFADFGALPDGSPDPAMAGTGRYFQVARPYPMVGSVTLFNIDPAVRTDTDNLWDATMEPGYTNVYRGFELSVQARMPNGGTVFGGWSLEDTGRNTIYNYDKGAGSRYGGEVNNCSDILARGDNPNELRFCDAGSYPRQLRNEFKLNGNYPFSLPGLGQMQVGASLQAYPGGAGDWGGLQEGLYVHRTQGGLTGTYSEELYGQPGHCVAPCELGARLVPAEASTVSTSTSNYWIPMIPLNSVKFVPYWTQLDLNVQKVFNIGNWRYDARFEFFNLLNNNVEIWHTGSRNARGSTGADYQTLSQWERAEKILEGRVIRFAITARF